MNELVGARIEERPASDRSSVCHLAGCESTNSNERRLTLTLDSIGDGVISTDMQGRITCLNRVAQELTGWSLEEAKERELSEVFQIIDGEDGRVMRSPFDAALSSGVAVDLEPNTTLIDRNGKRYLIEDSAALIRESVGAEPSGLVLVFRDVTARRKLELEVQQATKLEVIGRLAGGIAHDFNNTLVGITGYSEMLLLSLKHDSRLHRYASSILEAAEHAARLTSQLLAFSRKGNAFVRPVDLHARIESACALLSTSIDRGVLLVLRLNASLATVMGDPVMLEAAILNLAINACDASSAGEEVVIETNSVKFDQLTSVSEAFELKAAQYVEIIISDSGVGMSEEVKSHLFEPFFTTKDIGGGTGLGLASVYGTVQEHRGAILVESDLGKGAKFKVYLPLCESSVKEVGEEELRVVPGNGCVLLVDDEQRVRETTGAMLNHLGYEVLLAKDGVEALEIYKHEFERIQFVILDLVMPRMNGCDTFLALRKLNAEVKVVFASGHSFDKGAKELDSHGVFGFIQKPFRMKELYKVSQEALLDKPSDQRSVSIE